MVVITAIIFALLQFTPGDPIDLFVSPEQTLTPEQRASMERELGLDRPAPVRYGYWLREVAQGNLGYRIKTGESVTAVIRSRMGPTLILMTTSMLIGCTVGVALGVIAAVRKYTLVDYALTLFAFLGTSLPAFFAGLLALYLFALEFSLFPAGGMSTPGEPFSIADRLWHLVLPAAVLAFFQVGSVLRYTRAAMLEVLGQDFVRTASAKGLRNRDVVARHGLRNALLPVVTIIGASIPTLVGGAVFTESIFSWPGMGLLYLDAVNSRDYPLIMGLTLVISTVVLLANLLTDITYAIVDPRIRFG